MPKIHVSNSVKRKVIKRSNRVCEYCKSPADFSTEPFSIEHVIPTSKKGGNSIENLAFACIGCNVYKANRTHHTDILSQQDYPLFNPRTMVWTDHFLWDNLLTSVVAKTAIGRVTIEALKLNRIPLQNLRRALIAIGEHPPE